MQKKIIIRINFYILLTIRVANILNISIILYDIWCKRIYYKPKYNSKQAIDFLILISFLSIKKFSYL